MSYNIDKIEAKHGVFKFILNDQFIGNAINEYGEFSEIELSIMNKFIEKNDIVFDIGSNIGAFTIPLQKKLVKMVRCLPLNLNHLFLIYLNIMLN